MVQDAPSPVGMAKPDSKSETRRSRAGSDKKRPAELSGAGVPSLLSSPRCPTPACNVAFHARSCGKDQASCRAENGGDDDGEPVANTCVSVRDYYRYKFQMRPGIFNPILFGQRLFQQFAVNTYIKIESSRLDYMRNNQDTLRADLYQGLWTACIWVKNLLRMLEGVLSCLRHSSEDPVI